MSAEAMAGLEEGDPFGLNALLAELWEEGEQQLRDILGETKKLKNEIAELRSALKRYRAEVQVVEKGVQHPSSLQIGMSV